MKKNAVDHTENGGRAGDAERERDERRESESGVFQQHPDAVAKIVKECVHDLEWRDDLRVVPERVGRDSARPSRNWIVSSMFIPRGAQRSG